MSYSCFITFIFCILFIYINLYKLSNTSYVLRPVFVCRIFRNCVLEYMKSGEERKNWSVFDDSSTMWLFIEHFHKELSCWQVLNQGIKDKHLLSLNSLVQRKSFFNNTHFIHSKPNLVDNVF